MVLELGGESLVRVVRPAIRCMQVEIGLRSLLMVTYSFQNVAQSRSSETFVSK